MAKKLFVFIGLNVLIIICGALFLWHSYNPEPFNDLGMRRLQPSKVVSGAEQGTRYTGGKKIMVGLCAFLLIGCTIWFFYRKMEKDSQPDKIEIDNPLYKNSLTSGRTEFAPKNHSYIAEYSPKKEEVEATSLRDWVIALLILSGGCLLPVIIAVFFGFSHFW